MHGMWAVLVTALDSPLPHATSHTGNPYLIFGQHMRGAPPTLSLSSVQYFSQQSTESLAPPTEYPFVDHWKSHARPWFSASATSWQDDRTLPLDELGNPTSLLAGQVREGPRKEQGLAW